MYRTSTPRIGSKDTTVEDNTKLKKPSLQCPFCEKSFHTDDYLKYHLLHEDPCHSKYKNLGLETDKPKEILEVSTKIQFNSPPTSKQDANIPIVPPLAVEISVLNEQIYDEDLTSHFRINTLNKLHSLRSICMKSSDKSQYNFGGKSACTTIALEFCCHFLYNRISLLDSSSWNNVTMDDIVKAGCMLDPQKGNLSFVEVFTSNERYQEMLDVVEPSWQGDLKEEKSLDVAVQKLVTCLQHADDKKVGAIITKPPESIAIVAMDYSAASNGKINKLFVAFDSHPRTTDSKNHGAHSIIFIEQSNLLNYLKQWLFPYSQLVGSLDEMYNVFSITIVQKKPNTKFIPFSVDLLVEKSGVVPNNQSMVQRTKEKDENEQNQAATAQQLREENEKLQSENKDLKDRIKKLNEQVINLEKYKDLYTKLKQQDAKLNQSAIISNLKVFLDEHKRYQQTFSSVEGFFQNLVQAATSSNTSDIVEKK